MTPPRPTTGIRGRAPDGLDFGEIRNVMEAARLPRKDLNDDEKQASLPRVGPPPRMTEVLDAVLGPRLTVDNPVWSSDPVPRLRALQKILVEHSLRAAPDERRASLAAISEIERSVRLRLRWLQMKRSDMEREATDVQEKGKHEDPKATRRTAG